MGSHQNPVFLVGALRSGTTLLRLMIDSHPEVCNFGEFEFAVKYARGNEFPTMEEYTAELRRDRAFIDTGFAIDPGLNYEQLVHSFFEQGVAPSGKGVVGATVHSRFDLLREIWPDAKYIHLCRDPRDVARSCIGMGWVGNVYAGTEYWLSAERQWETLRQIVPPESTHEITFEDLVASPREELGRICEWVGVPYDEKMLAYSEDSTYQPPDASLANQWQRKLSPSEIRDVESKCAHLMEQRGYSLASGGGSLPLVRRAGLAIHNRTSRAVFNARRTGLSLYCQSKLLPLARRVVPKYADSLMGRMHDVERQFIR